MAKKEKAEKKKSTYGNLSENWKTVAAQGALALLIGVIIVAVPSLSEKVVRYMLGGFLIVYAVLSFVSARSAAKESQPTTWLYFRTGVAAAGGLLILFWPGFTERTLVYMLAVFAIAAGFFVGITGVLQKWNRTYKGIVGFGGLASIAFGIILISYASSATGSIIWMTGVYGMLFGLLMILMGAGARGMADKTQ
jgi:uncharacterized membrane protein HdeD (DUF308 family)